MTDILNAIRSETSREIRYWVSNFINPIRGAVDLSILVDTNHLKMETFDFYLPRMVGSAIEETIIIDTDG